MCALLGPIIPNSERKVPEAKVQPAAHCHQLDGLKAFNPISPTSRQTVSALGGSGGGGAV